MISFLPFSNKTACRLNRTLALSLSIIVAGTICGAPEAKCVADAVDKTVVTSVNKNKNSTPAALNLQQIPNLIDIPQTPESIERVGRLEEEGEKLFQSHNLDRALIKWQEAYGLSLEMKYSEGEGRSLTNMGRIFLERGQFVKAKYMGENAIEVLSGVSDQRALGRAHLYLAQAYFGLDNSVWAGQQLEAAMKCFTASGDNNAPDTARLMILAASVLMNMGKFKEAIQFFEAAATYFTQAQDYPRAIATHLKVVDLLLSQGLLTAAQEEADKAVAVARSNPDTPGNLLAPLSALANCRYSLGEFWQARKTYEQANQLALKLSAKELNGVGRAHMCLGYGSTLFACGDADQARQYLEKAFEVFKNAGLSLPEAEAANILGVLEASQGHPDKALLLFEEALDLNNLISPKNDGFHIQILANYASVESRLGKNRDARIHLENAVGPAKKLKDFAQVGRLYAAEAEVALMLADPALAQQLLRVAIDDSSKANDDSALWREHTLLAKIQLDQHATKEAHDSLVSALSFFRSPQAGAFPAPEQISYPTTREDLAEQLVAMLASQGMAEQAFLATEQLKEESFINGWLQHGGEVRAEDAELYNDLMSQRAHLHAAEVSSPPSKIIKEWQSWMARDRALVSQNRVLARLIAPVPTNFADVVKAVQASRATVLEYLMGSDSTVVFTLSGNGHVAATVLPVGRKKLETQVSSLLAAVPKADEIADKPSFTEKSTLQALGGELLPPDVVSQLPTNPDQIIVIIPDRILFNLPFAALMNQQGKYFIEQHTITMASSIGVFIDSPPRYADDLSLVVASAAGSKTSDGASEDEASQISGLFEPEAVTRLVGKDADIKAIQEQSKGKAIVHIADDFSFAPSNPLRSPLPAGFSTDADKRATAGSLFGLNIPSDLLVWSGTSVNAKDVQGNALKVFTRGLNYAGVRNVLMSLWVEPSAQRTSELMDFYKNKQAGLNQAESLRKAELIALSKDPSPRTWAAFQLVGPGY